MYIFSPECCFLNLSKKIGIAMRIKCNISSVQSLSCVWLFPTPWTAAWQASLSITNSQRLLKLMAIESVMPSNHLILCCPLLLPRFSQGLSQWVSSSHQVVKVLEFQLQHQSFQSTPGGHSKRVNSQGTKAISLPPQSLFQWVSSLHQVTKVLELQPQHQSFHWIFRTDFL